MKNLIIGALTFGIGFTIVMVPLLGLYGGLAMGGAQAVCGGLFGSIFDKVFG
jgi:hypothetical protein